MRLLYLTAGAADMYCGSCLRDNALAAALKGRGHDVVLMPIYTPTRTDEPNVSESRVFFGGISVYLQQHVPLLRRTPALLDRLWDAEPVLRLASKRQIKVDPSLLGRMTVSMLRGTDGNQAKEIDKLQQWLAGEPRFDVVNLPFALLIGLARPLRERLKVPIACTLQGEDLFLEQLGEPWRADALALIRRAVADVDLFIAVSDYYRTFMTTYLGIDPARIRTVPLGISMEGHAPRPPRRTPPWTIGYFARIAPEKGLHVLADAYRRLRERTADIPMRLLAGGYLLEEHRGYFADITRRMGQWGLGAEFRYAGSPDRPGKIALFREMDVFSMPATYDEPKGLSVLEAMANGVPVVQPRRGAFPEIIERTGGAVLVPPDDPERLAEALHALLTDRDRAAALGAAGAAGVRRHYDVAHMADRAEAVYGELGRGSGTRRDGP
jgi:glycosyltransferase involved in cell wall biosynthesis